MFFCFWFHTLFISVAYKCYKLCLCHKATLLVYHSVSKWGPSTLSFSRMGSICLHAITSFPWLFVVHIAYSILDIRFSKCFILDIRFCKCFILDIRFCKCFILDIAGSQDVWLHGVPYWCQKWSGSKTDKIPYCIFNIEKTVLQFIFCKGSILHIASSQDVLYNGGILLPNGVEIDRMFSLYRLRSRLSWRWWEGKPCTQQSGGACVLVFSSWCWKEMEKTKEFHQEHNCFH